MVAKIQTAFALGLMIAKNVHGITKPDDLPTANAVMKVLEQVANGEVTLLNTPGETTAALPLPPEKLAAFEPRLVNAVLRALADQMNEAVPQAMREHREVAGELLELMKLSGK